MNKQTGTVKEQIENVNRINRTSVNAMNKAIVFVEIFL